MSVTARGVGASPHSAGICSTFDLDALGWYAAGPDEAISGALCRAV